MYKMLLYHEMQTRRLEKTGLGLKRSRKEVYIH
jgi:hypothetical protein